MAPASLRLAWLLVALPLAEALTITAATPGRAAPAAAAEYSWAHALVNRDISADDLDAAPPPPRMELVDMQRLDMELYDREMRLAEEWSERLVDGRLVGGDDDDIVHYD